ncbi:MULTISPECIES: GIY-YIG nuclease family protein [Shewanella]|uniref:GIY-YIG nuclease family protein n=1 Tax=Shewanella TaxID=22 RepID=UPI003007D8B8
MLITIAVSLLFVSSIYLWLMSRSKLKEIKIKAEILEKTYEPASNAENKLSVLSKGYHSLQDNYKRDIKLLREGEKRLSQYYLGVGTSDTISYSRISNTNDLAVIEQRLQKVKESIKSLISNKQACVCTMGNDVVVNGKKSEAKKLFNREIKLRLRCLDNEFNAAAAIIDWNNVNRLIQRTKDTFAEINSSGQIVKTRLNESYLKLKIEELRLTYELTQLKQEIKENEREELRIQREAEREETRIKAAAEKAEKDRVLMEKLVAEELSKLESSTEEQKALYELHKQELEKLKEKEKRAISLAQLTRSGYVYVISNPTSFGDRVCKIGMTRRADPNDRVKELGDASVPELFDVHSFVFTEDAPALEKYLHERFSKQRVNLVNKRKEFFYVSPSQVVAELQNYDGEIIVDMYAPDISQLQLGREREVCAQTKILEEQSAKTEEELTGEAHIQEPIIKMVLDPEHLKAITSLIEALHKVIASKNGVSSSFNPIFNSRYSSADCDQDIDSAPIKMKIKALVTDGYPDDDEMQKEVYEEQLEAKAFMDNVTDAEVKALSIEEYPDDYCAQKYEYEEQLEAKAFMDNVTDAEVKALAIEEYPDDYSAQKYEYEEQLEAKAFMDNVTDAEVKDLAIEEYPDDYSAQKYEYEEQLEAKAFMDKVIDAEVRALAIKECPNDYSAQKYEYEELIRN